MELSLQLNKMLKNKIKKTHELEQMVKKQMNSGESQLVKSLT